ncbi:cation diffusion facilitator family transporter [Sphingomonas oligoaromativorans]|uniref:cation diffusion facilitator family transporter n=1 Tax=Sphingomonas oligoaromativorans TaxID=575322 RepID=UPI00141E3EF8|nr:cation diffusion facilitator family transporter [Sphingomonas oligoaromativorans]NIJ33250.1 cobalt-zinc-cadmium efflux system protein [Sphingomonas oligoaromativorans]
MSRHQHDAHAGHHHDHEAHDHDHHGHGHGHDHGHDHHHHHGLGHSHAPASFGRAFAIGTALNFAFVGVEAAYGLVSGSMALLADAGHNLGDVLGLLIAWGATVLARRGPGGRYTYGLRSSSILAALLNALLLLVTLGVIAVEAIRRLLEPAPVSGGTMMIVAGIGIVINTATALMFMRGRDHDLNIRGAFLHMAADAVISAGVVAAGLLVVATGWSWIDPVTSLILVVVTAIGTWGLLRDSVNLSLHAAPPGFNPEEIGAFLRGVDKVTAIHDLHIWPISTTETALTVHMLMPSGYPGDAFTVEVAASLRARFGIDHATIQIETEHDTPCALDPACRESAAV